MEAFTAAGLYRATILTYLLAACMSLVLMKRQRACNIISNAICIAASLFGAAASVMHIFSGTGSITISLIESNIPFVSLDLRVDNLSAFFVLALSILAFCVSLYSIGYISHYIGKRNVGLFNTLYSTFIISMILVFTTANAISFFICWEAMAVLSYFLVIFESEHKENQKAGTLYIIMTHIASALLLIGFMIIYYYTKSFDIFGSSAAIPAAAKNVIFILFLIGFGTKAGMIPLHIWLPYAHPASPSNVSALMSGIMIKTAIYGLLRFVLCYLGVQNTWWGMLLLCIGAVSAVLGVAYALLQKNIKRLLAFSSVENIGIILIGLGVCFIATAQKHPILSGLALTASLLHTINHTLFKGGLFLGAGSIQYATHTKNMDELGGMIKKMPVTALFLLCFSLAVSAIVPFNGFASEWLTYQSLFANIAAGQSVLSILSILSVAALGLTGALAAACFVKLFGITFLGRARSEHAEHAEEVPVSMKTGMGILAALCLVLGLFPRVILGLIDNVASALTGSSIFNQLQGGFLVAYYPLELSAGSIAPAAVLIAIAAFVLLALLLARIIGGKFLARKYGTWDCGYEELNARMQYSSFGFVNPLKVVFKVLYRPSPKIEATGEHAYHPKTIAFTTTTESVFEEYFYKPFYGKVKAFSRMIKFRVQTGFIQSYLIYIFVVVLILMAYNRFVG
jgi:formate hydrogenlyase subunit 3/multisubunit Na+/H+ antiporter MnhD subunit